METPMQGLRAGTRLGAGIGIGLALAGCASPPAAPPSGNAPVPATPVARETQSRPDFSGRWALNAKASDDPQEKVKAAMQSMQPAMGGGQGMRGGMGGGMRGGMGGGRQGRGMGEGMAARSPLSPEDRAALTATPARLDITHEDPMLLIADESERRQRLYTDFRGASVSAKGGLDQKVTLAGWEGPVLVVETTMRGGTRLIQSYRIDAGTGQLTISSVAQVSEAKPIAFRLVYDRLKPGMEVGSRY